MNHESVKDGREDTDHTFLEDVLNKLYDFGDGTRNGKKKKSMKSKRRKCNEEEEELTFADNCSGTNDQSSGQTEQNISSVVVSESSQAWNISVATKRPSQIETVIFQDPLKKKKSRNTPAPEVKPPPTEEKKKAESEDFSLEKARLEVHRFGITGYQKEQQRLFEQERAIMLGAKPPKKEYINYKVYQQMIKDKKLKVKEEAKLDNKKKKKRESKARDEKRKSSSGILPTGQVGRFKNGMLVLSSKEIQRIKSSKVIK